MNIPLIPNTTQISGTDPVREVSPRKSSSTTSIQDTVSIGEESRMVSRLMARMKAIQNSGRPDLDRLKQQIESGAYAPSPDEIARAILFGPPFTK